MERHWSPLPCPDTLSISLSGNVISVPFNALAPDLTGGYDEATDLINVRVIMEIGPFPSPHYFFLYYSLLQFLVSWLPSFNLSSLKRSLSLEVKNQIIKKVSFLLLLLIYCQ